jgi:REP element-mobilizing transposase RayT
MLVPCFNRHPQVVRQRRPYLPGTAFHLVSRTIGHEPWLATFRDEIVSMLGFAFAHTDAVPHAFVIMSNHFHLIVRQGRKPLASVMQPLCRKIALRTQLLHTREGHIFERRFRAKPCLTPQHLRLAIAYTHLNPVKANLCAHPREYPWSSHWAYVGRAAPANVQRSNLVLVPQLQLFAAGANRSPRELVADYARFAKWCHASSHVAEDDPRLAEPATAAGDLYWDRNFSALPAIESATLPDLDHFVRTILSEIAPWLTLLQLQLCRGGAAITEVRHTIIKRAVICGYRRSDIARKLNVSVSTVSKVVTSLFDGPRGQAKLGLFS